MSNPSGASQNHQQDHQRRAKTIAVNGEIVPKPYGVSRWASPRRYACAHTDCTNAAKVTARSGQHQVDPDAIGPERARAHNCCGQHD